MVTGTIQSIYSSLSRKTKKEIIMGMFSKVINAIINGVESNSVTINGKTYKGRNITVTDTNVIIDGKEVDIADRKVEIIINGNVGDVSTASGKVDVKGDAKSVSTAYGDVKVASSVTNYVDTKSGSIEIGGDVGGNVRTTSGDVLVVRGSIKGNVDTISGDVSCG